MADKQRSTGQVDLGAHRFSFVVIADTHVNQEDDKASSDFAVNRLSNARNRHVMHEISRRRPEFVLHLGDIVHPTPVHPGYATAAGSFHGLAQALACPLYLTAGNHDVGDKPGDWLPVPSVSDAFLTLYEQHFGRHFYAFDSNGCHFVVINAQIINSGLECEAAQKKWLEDDLAAHSGKRIFLATHYPPYLCDPAEQSHYDNIDEPGRTWLLDLLTQHRVEAVFAGHVHNFWYHLHGETDIYLLPSTAFVRLDYAELYRVEAGPERGRNDAPKLGFFVVDVHERGHVAHAIRTFGATLAAGEAPDTSSAYLPPVHVRSIAHAPVGIDLRYPWAELTQVAASGALDEFSRKLARNDYPLMALWEMGVRRLRVPIGDLADPAVRERMRTLRRNGHEFTVYTHGVPSGALRDLLLTHADLVAAWEVVASRRALPRVLEQVRDVKQSSGLTVYLSKLRRHDDAHHHGDRARHAIEHGFLIEDRDEIEEALRAGVCDGFLFRVAQTRTPWNEIAAIARLADELGTRGHAYVRLASDNPAVAMTDDAATANRVAETIAGARCCAGVRVWLDTLNDVDRGYFPRSGLVDRRYNPRMAGHVFRHLQSALDGAGEYAMGESIGLSGARMLTWTCARETSFLLLPEREMPVAALTWSAKRGLPRDGRWIDLVTGQIRTLGFACNSASESLSLSFGAAPVCRGPALFCFSD